MKRQEEIEELRKRIRVCEGLVYALLQCAEDQYWVGFGCESRLMVPGVLERDLESQLEKIRKELKVRGQ